MHEGGDEAIHMETRLKRRKIKGGESSAGVVAIELALLLPILMLLLMGGVEFGRAIHHKMQLASAVRAGAAYATLSTFDGSTELDSVAEETGRLCTFSPLPNIQDTMCQATNLTSSAVTVTPTRFCECDVSGTVTTSANCTSTCTGGTLREYVTVTASEDFTTLITYPGIGSPIPLTESLTVRVD